MRPSRSRARTGRQIVLLVVAALLSASALLAVGILLLGHFGETEGKILGTTAMLAGYTLLALPAAMLVDRRRLPALAATVVALAAIAAPLAITMLWWGDDPPEPLVRAFGTATVWLVAFTQTAALAVRRAERDPRSVVRLFRGSIGLVAVAASLATALIWSGEGGPGWGRLIGSLVVLDVLSVALQPILALARPRLEPTRLRLRLDSGDAVDLTLDAADVAAAAAKAIRTVEREGRRVVSLDVLDAPAAARSAVARADEPDGNAVGGRDRAAQA